MEKFAGYIIILHTCTKNHNTWCMVPEIRSERDIILSHIGQYFATSPTPCPFPQWSQKTKLKKTKKKKNVPGDIILLYIYV